MAGAPAESEGVATTIADQSAWSYTPSVLQEAHSALRLADHPGVFMGQPFQPSFIPGLLNEIASFEEQCASTGVQITPPSVLVHDGVVLNQVPGASEFFEGFIADYLSPAVAACYPQYSQGLCPGDFIAMVVRYSASRTDAVRAMRPHCDDSCITLSICLGDEFEGGDLVFGDTHIPQRPGHAILFPGSLEHSTAPLTSGSRTNLVLWCVSTRKAQQSTGQICSEYITYLEHSVPRPLHENQGSVCFDIPTQYMGSSRAPSRRLMSRLQARQPTRSDSAVKGNTPSRNTLGAGFAQML
eukprot:TRINITY_DN10174_c0_g1_i2.p1 TRINITY_DN10174_c0_g1~~TRINITY_DN10174_c0_g1_i2.p1  ORF type:complete len:298 (+),score=29.82 TRINITY_DN10174_c0_g1_i2:181-1074(+)